MGNNVPYSWLAPQDPRRFQTDREILEQLIDLSESSLTSSPKEEVYDSLDAYKKYFSLHGNGNQFRIYRQLSVKADMKSKIDKDMNKLVILGILKKELLRFYSPEMAIHRMNSDISRVVADFRYLKTRLPQLEQYDLYIVFTLYYIVF